MSMKCYVVLPIALLLFSPCVPVVATCEGDPPGHPFCYECKDGVWVLRYFALCGQDSDCTGECHDGCSPTLCMCEIDASKCVGDCNSCLPFSGVCYDDPAGCPGECEDCIDGSCVDENIYCGTGCQTCQNGTCVDNNDECDGCLKCENDECVPDDSKCPGCQKCLSSGGCQDDDSKCNAANCETCVNSECKVCGGDPTKKCCPDETCHDECQNTPPTGDCDSSHSEEYKCQICFMPGAGITCLDLTTRVYTGNINHSCSGGCSGDCEDKPDVHCYTEYKCAHKDVLKDYACVVFGNGEWGCTGPDMIIFCPRCKKDPEDQGEKYYRPHQACK